MDNYIEEYKKTAMYKALVELDKKFAELGMGPFELHVVGGFAMIGNGLKDSYVTDIDYVGEKFYDDDLDRVVDKIGMKNGLEKGWLNNDLMLSGTTLEDLELATGKLHFHPLFEMETLSVSILDAKDLLRMKVLSVDTSLTAIELGGDFTRAKDLPDIKQLMNRRSMNILDLEMETYTICDISDSTYELIDEYNKTQDLGKITQMVESKIPKAKTQKDRFDRS